MNETYCVGKVSESNRLLVEVAHDCLMKAIDACKPGAMYRDCGNIVANHVEPLGFSVVRSY
jgi:methionyl aminopeptidase